MISLYSRFITFQRNRTSSFIESPIMEYFRRLVSGSERSTAALTESLSNENFDGSEALPRTHYVSPISPAETHMETSILGDHEGHACCPLCLTTFGLSTHTSITRLSCGTSSMIYEYPTRGSRVHVGHRSEEQHV